MSERQSVNLFCVASPLQFINALEAVDEFRLQDDKNILLLLVNDNPRNTQQLFQILDFSQWESVFTISLGSRNVISMLHRLIDIRSVISKLPAPDRVLMGHYLLREVRQIANAFPNAKRIILDDGNCTRHISESRFANARNHECPPASILGDILGAVFGLSARHIPNATFFSMRANLMCRPGDEIVVNQYKRLREQRHQVKVDPQQVWFIGTHVVELGIVKYEQYLTWMKRVAKHLAGKKIVYCCHRLETTEKLQRMQEHLDFEFRRPKSILELELINAPVLPGTLAGFWSALFDTCGAIFSGQISFIAFDVCDELPPGPLRDDIRQIYKDTAINLGDAMSVVKPEPSQ
ncbi:MAG: hypothetical protein K8S55_05835 [Phycisphaerae bacterium]|nr:hypothetical protein [Phycisphaerae bacterium]